MDTLLYGSPARFAAGRGGRTPDGAVIQFPKPLLLKCADCDSLVEDNLDRDGRCPDCGLIHRVSDLADKTVARVAPKAAQMPDINAALHMIERFLIWGVALEAAFAAGLWVALQVFRGVL